MVERKESISFLIGVALVLLFGPLVLSFDANTKIGVFPALYIYIFGSWLLFILCTYLIYRKQR